MDAIASVGSVGAVSSQVAAHGRVAKEPAPVTTDTGKAALKLIQASVVGSSVQAHDLDLRA